MTPFLWTMAAGFVLGLVLLIVFGSRKKPKVIGIVISIILSLACVVGFIADISISPVKSNNNSSQVVDENTSFEEIYAEFKRNKLNAQDLYNDNKYRITAKVNGIETDGLLNIDGGATLTMETKVDNTTVFFLASFGKEQEEALKKISVGDTISFIGVCKDGSFDKCELTE
ncbi:MAG: hypothetical protein PHV32_09585 [Eubacteriales bacterium]|nr:hypothetical protein [Eubacteriales bacterium]